MWSELPSAQVGSRVRVRRKLLAAAIEPLERRTLLTTVAWDGGIGGNGTNFLDPVNWLGDVLPGLSDVASVGATGSSPLITISGTVNVPTINTSRNIQLTGGTISGSTINATGAASLIASSSGGNLVSSTLNCNFDLKQQGNANVRIYNGLVLNGTATLGDDAGSTYGRLYFGDGSNPAGTLSGNAIVTFGGNVNNNWIRNDSSLTGASGTLTLAPTVTVGGKSGGIYSNVGTNPSILNRGTINVGIAGGNINLGYRSTNTFTNTGVINVTAGTLLLEGTSTLSGLGTINRTGGVINLSGVLDLQNGPWNLNAATGSWNLLGGSIKNGTINETADALLNITNSGGTLTNITINGALDLSQQNNANVRIYNGLVLNGTATLGNQDGSTYGRLYFGDDANPAGTLSGNAIVTFGGNVNNNWIRNDSNLTGASGTLTLAPTVTVGGKSGGIYSNVGTNPSILNRGTINVGIAGGNINLGYRSTNTFTNTGVINVTAGTLLLEGTSTLSGLGTINRTGGVINLSGVLDLQNGPWNLNAATGSWNLLGGSIKNGTINETADALLNITNSGGTLTNITINGALDLSQQNNANVRIYNGLVLNGTATLGNQDGSTYGRLYFGDDANPAGTLSGNAIVTFGGNVNNNWIRNDSNLTGASGTLTLAPTVTVGGKSGGIYSNVGTNPSILNRGTINVGIAGGNINLGYRSTNTFTNTGVINVTAGTLLLEGTSTLSGLGTINRTGGVINLSGVLDLQNGPWNLNAATGSWNLLGGSIKNGTINETADALLNITNSGGTLTNITINGALDLSQQNNANVRIYNGLVLNGTATLGNQDGSTYGRLYFGDDANPAGTLSGNAIVTFGGNVNNNWIRNDSSLTGASGTLTLAPTVTVGGKSGGIYSNVGTNPSILNRGTINVGIAGGNINLGYRSTNTFTNTGVINVTAGTLLLEGTSTLSGLGTINRTGGVINLSGVLDLQNGPWNLNAATGSWNLLGGSIKNGTINETADALLNITNSGGTLTNITINGALDLSQQNNANVRIYNGLVLNGTATLGNQDGSTYGRLYFGDDANPAGTLSGNAIVTFGGNVNNNWIRNDSNLTGASGTLTLAPTVTVGGKSGGIYSNVGTNPSILNRGTINVGIAGGNINLGYRSTNTFTNTGVINVTAGTLLLEGTSTLSGLGTINRTGGVINLSGVLDLQNGPWNLNAATGSWNLLGGSIKNGTINETADALLNITNSGGTLTNITINGALDLSQQNNANVRIYNGLVLNGTATLGNQDGSTYGRLYFGDDANPAGTLSGNAIVTFGGRSIGGNYIENSSNLTGTAGTLTLAPTVTVSGKNGSIYNANWPNPTLLNQGIINASITGGTISVGGNSTSNFTNTGTLAATNGNLSFPSTLWLNGSSNLNVQAGRSITVAASLLGNTTNFVNFQPAGTTILGGTASVAAPNLLEVMAQDLGTDGGASNNFSYGTLNVTGGNYVRLVDQSDNFAGVGNEAIYVDTLNVAPGATLDLNGFKIYARANIGTGTIIGTPNTVVDPDLQVTNISVSPSAPASGQKVTVNWNDHNYGGGSAVGGWTDHVTVIDSATGHTLFTEDVAYSGNLGAGLDLARTSSFTLPAGNAGVGSFTVTITTDYTNVIHESNAGSTAEINNVTPLSFTSTLGSYPDLTVIGLSTNPAAPKSGNDLTINWTDKNNGSASTGTGYSNRVTVINTTTGQTLFDRTVANATIGANGSAARSATFTLPEGAAGVGALSIKVVADLGNAIGEFNAAGTGETNNESTIGVTSTLATYADLTVSDITLQPSTLKSGNLVTISWKDNNTGDGPTGGAYQNRIIVTNTSTGVTFTDDSKTYTTSLAGGGSVLRSATFQIPDGAAGVGVLSVSIEADYNHAVTERNAAGDAETNNTTTLTATSTLADYADLITVNATITPTPVFRGSQATVSWTDANAGTARAVSWTDRIYVTNVGTGQSFIVGNLPSPVGGLEAGDVFPRTHTFTMPGNTVVGNYTVSVVTDSSNQVPEYNTGGTGESNNTATSPAFSVMAPPTPDLTISVATPTTAYSGRQLNVSWTVRNSGSAAATGNWTDTIYLIPVDGAPTKMISVERPRTLPVGQSYTLSRGIPIANGVSGSYTILVVANETQSQGESDTTNNVGTSGQFQIVLSPYADLTVEEVKVPASAIAEQPLSISWVVKNVGEGGTDASIWYDHVYLSPSATTLDLSSAIDFGVYRNQTYLGRNESYTQLSTPRAIPAGRTGTYYAWVITDSTNTQYEYLHETDNNRAASATPVQIDPVVDPAMFQPTTVLVNPKPTVYSGATVTVTWTVQNSGGHTISGNWSDELYLSRTPQTDTAGSDAISLGRKAKSGPLAPGDSYTASLNVTLPTGLTGAWYIVPAVDRDDTASGNGGATPAHVEKHQIASDLLNITVPPHPKLIVPTVQSAPTAQAGQTLAVNWRVTNEGFASTDVGAWTDSVYLSRTPDLGGSPILLGTQTRAGGLPALQSYDALKTFPLRSDLSGQYYVVVKTDSGTQVPFNDATANIGYQSSPITIAPYVYTPPTPGNPNPGNPNPPPTDPTTGANASNLQPNIKAAPTNAGSGDTVSVSWEVTNIGPFATAASSWSDTVYLSDHNDLAGSGVTTIGTYSHNGSVGIGASYSGNASFKLPDGVTGTYYVFVVSNSDQRAYEGPGGNIDNTVSRALTVSATPPPQLKVSIPDILGLVANQPSTVSWTVQNLGAGSTRSAGDFWTDRIYLSDTGALDGTAQLLKSIPHSGALAPGASYTASASITPPLGSSGLKYLLVFTDFDQLVYQVDRTGTAAPRVVTVQAAPSADLSVTSVTTPSSGFAGQSINVGWVVTNDAGASPTGVATWTDTVYYSHDQYFTLASATPLQSFSHSGALAPGASYTASQSVNIPASANGPYYIFVRTDATSRVYEAGAVENNVANAATSTEIAFPPPGDLQASNVTAPANGVGGLALPSPVTWTVTNVGARDAVGSWSDAVYLSADGNFDSSDKLITRVTHTGTLRPGESYTGTTSAVLPAVVVPGGYRIIVRADAQSALRETAEQKLNNQAVSLTQIAMNVPELTIDALTNGVISFEQDLYYRVSVQAGQDLQLTSTFAHESQARFYVSYGQPPTPSDFDEVYASANDKSQTIDIPNTVDGTYYVLLHGTGGAGGGASFSILAKALGFGLDRINLSTGSDQGEVTLTLSGAQFKPTAIAALVGSDGLPHAATRTVWKDGSTIWSTFDLTGVSLGEYSVKLTQGVQTSTLSNAFTVQHSAPGSLQVHATSPGILRAGLIGQVTFEYENVGNTDIPAPLLLLGATGAKLVLDSGEMVTQQQVLGINTSGPAGTLTPGYRGTFTYRFKPNSFSAGGNNSFSLSVKPVADLAQPIDWDLLKDVSRPLTVSTAAWDGIWSNFAASVGNTVGDLQTALGNTATYLSQLNRYTSSEADLIGFKYTQANDGIVQGSLSSATDISLEAPGLPLELPRSFSNTITNRTSSGMFGSGWRTIWDSKLVALDANTILVDLSIGQIKFARQSGGAYLAAAGQGTLAMLAGGKFVYTDANRQKYAFTQSGLLESLRSAGGEQITATFGNAETDSRTVPKILRHSNGMELALEYNVSGAITKITSSTGEIATYVYDAPGQHLLAVTTSRGSTQYTYDTTGVAARLNNLLTVSNPDGTHQSFQYDAAGRLRQVDGDVADQRRTLTYDSDGGITVTDAGGAKTQYFMTDALGVGRFVDALGNATRIEYDAAGKPVKQVLSGNFTYLLGYDSNARLTSVTDPLGARTTFSYNAATGLPTAFTDPRGGKTTYSYDGFGNPLTITAADGTNERFTYDSTGVASSYVNRRGQTVSYTRNSAGQVTRETFADTSHNDFTYDTRGNLLTSVDPSGTTTFTYDGADRLTGVTYPNSVSLAFGYDSNGRRSQMTDQSGFVVRYAYDAAGRLLNLKDGGGTLLVSYTYNARGLLARQDEGNGSFTTYSYDLAGNVQSVQNHAAGGTINSSFVYAYDTTGRRISATTSTGKWDYTYDAAGRITTASFKASVFGVPDQKLEYAYDISGNRISTLLNGVSTTYITNSRNLYSSVGGTPFTYDNDGNLTSDGTSTFGYNLFGNLTSATTGGVTTDFTYNALGQRLSSTVAGATTRFAIDPINADRVAGEFDAAGSPIAHDVFGAELVGRFTSAGRYFAASDGIGSTSELTGANGAIVNQYSFDPFGNVLSSSGSVANPFRYQGAEGAFTVGTALSSFQGRTFDSALGRTLSQPSLGSLGQAGESPFASTAGNGSPLVSTLQIGSVRRAIGAVQNQPRVTDLQNSVSTSFTVAGSETTLADNASADSLTDIVNSAVWPITAVSSAVATYLPPALLPPAQTRLAGTRFASGAIAQGLQSLSLDPNSITAPAGYGASAMVGVSAPIGFRIDFENLETATANAQVVTITNPLSENLDWRTVELKTIEFNHHVINIPEHRSFFSTNVLVPSGDSQLLVVITAGIDPLTGILRWTLSSIDPLTGEPPTDSSSGLLPINNAAGDGQGFVTYTIRGKSSVSTGTEVYNSASIVFDDQPPLETNTSFNTLDTVAPTGGIVSVVKGEGRNYDVTWTGEDDEIGAGLANFDVYVSTDGGRFVPWLMATDLTTSAFNAVPGHSYAFYSIGRDNADNLQQPPTGVTPQISIPASTVVGRSLFYRGTNGSDDGAIATDKQALLPGQTASFANYTSFDRGINGIMIDLAGNNGRSLSAADFTFKVGNSNTPSAWTNATAPTSVIVRAGEGANGSDRVEIIWADNVIQKQWLEITMLANANTGLTAADVFYFGNAIGDSGNSTANAIVNASDEIAARNNPRTFANPAPIDFAYDYNRDGRVNATDEIIARNNGTTFATALKLITIPGPTGGRRLGSTAR